MPDRGRHQGCKAVASPKNKPTHCVGNNCYYKGGGLCFQLKLSPPIPLPKAAAVIDFVHYSPYFYLWVMSGLYSYTLGHLPVEAAVAEAVSSRLESLESEVRLLSSELVRCRELVIQFSATEKAAFQEKFDAVQLQFQTSSSYFDQKLEDSMRQLKEHVRLSKTLMNSWCRGAAARVANCEEMVSKAALQPVSTVSTEQDAVLNAVMGRIEQEKVEREAEMLLMKRDLNELRGACALRRPVKSAKTRSPSRRIQNASPRNRPLCRRQGWASASFRALSSPVTHQENHTLSASVDFASEEKRGSQVDLGNPQDLVQQVSELQREPLRAETGKTGVEPLGQARNSWSPSSTFSP